MTLSDSLFGGILKQTYEKLVVIVNKKIRLNLPGYYDKKEREDWSCELGQNTIGLPINRVSGFGVLEYQKFQMTMTKVSVFSVQVSASIFLFPDT